jgi:ABC-2 type transporter
MRWRILRTLLLKEWWRLLANKGGVSLLLLLVVASMLLSFFGTKDGATANVSIGIQHCYIDYANDGPLVRHLKSNVPAELRSQLTIRPLAQSVIDGKGTVGYPQATGAIQLRPLPDDPNGPGMLIWFWHPGEDGSSLAPYEAWLWRETLAYYRKAQTEPAAGIGSETERATPGRVPPIVVKRSSLSGGLDERSGLATALVLFAIFFVCVYLQSSLTCEERERGVLLAQALSPATSLEILAAKFIFYPTIAMALALVAAGTYKPVVLTQSFFWLSLVISIFGSMSIGLTVSSLARTQRSASIGAMCYMLSVAVLLFICQHNSIPLLPYLALEYYCPRLLHAAMTGSVQWYHWGNLLGAGLLTCGWMAVATWLFRRCGWQ